MTSRSPWLAALSVALLAAAPVGAAGPEGVTPDDLEERTTGTLDPEERRVAPTDPSDLEGRAIDPGSRETVTRDVDEAPSEDDLPVPPAPAADEDPEVAAALAKVREARERALEAQRAYADMKRENYPRGEARAAIVRERDEALAAYEAAKKELRALGGVAASD